MKRSEWDNEKLFNRLLNGKTEKAYWNNISELRKRGNKDFFKECSLLIKSEIEKERMIGIDILSQLNSPTEIRPFFKQVFDIFIELLQYEKTPSILMSILYGIGHNSENLVLEKDIELIASYKASEHSCVREGVVFALIGIDNRIAIEALVELSKDKYCFIRDWAVLGLGSLIDTDNTLIREALYERLFDKHQKTKEEAIVGLARRKDLRVKNIRHCP